MNPLRKYAYHTKWTIGFSTQSLLDVVEKNLPLDGFKWMCLGLEKVDPIRML